MNHKVRRTKISMIILAGISLVGMQNAIAQVSSIPGGGNLNANTPNNGDIWNLQGDAYLSNGSASQASTALPANLAINGVTGGSTITLNDGAGHYNYFSGTAATVLNLSNVTITGGSASAFGGSLQGGAYELEGGVSSQFITGLICALVYRGGDSLLHILPPDIQYEAHNNQVLLRFLRLYM